MLCEGVDGPAVALRCCQNVAARDPSATVDTQRAADGCETASDAGVAVCKLLTGYLPAQVPSLG